MAFPTNPVIGDQFTYGVKTYKWDGNVWSRTTVNLLNTANIAESGGKYYYSNTLVKQLIGNYDGDITPSTNEQTSIGSSLNKWSNLYLSNNTIFLGNTRIKSNEDGSLSILSANVLNDTAITFASNGYITAPAGILSTSTGFTDGTPKISNVQVTDSSYVITGGNTTNSGSYVTISGSDFTSSSNALFGNIAANSVSYVSSSQLNVALPILSPGSYSVFVVNSDGASAQRVNGLNII